MLALILILIVGSLLVYISQFNFMLVSVNLGFYAFSNIPLFYVIVASALFGLVLSYVVYLIHSISTSLTIRGKDNKIKEKKEDVLELTKRVHQHENIIGQTLESTPSLQGLAIVGHTFFSS